MSNWAGASAVDVLDKPQKALGGGVEPGDELGFKLARLG